MHKAPSRALEQVYKSQIRNLRSSGFHTLSKSTNSPHRSERILDSFPRTRRGISHGRVSNDTSPGLQNGRSNPGRVSESFTRDDPDILHDNVSPIIEEETGIEHEHTIAQGRFDGLSQATPSNTVPKSKAEQIRYQILQLRKDGVSQEDIARAARNAFGDSLPRDALNEEEIILYRRLYGEPAWDVGDDIEHLATEDEPADRMPQSTLYSASGDEIEVYKTSGEKLSPRDVQEISIQMSEGISETSLSSSEQRYLDARDIAKSLDAELIENEPADLGNEAENDDDDESFARFHPLTRLGKFATNPRTIFLPQEELLRPIERVMSDFSNKHLKETCERIFGGSGLPDSPLTPRSSKFKQQVAVPLEAGQHTMGEMEANAFITTIMPPTYASVMSVLVETRKRLGSSWLNRLMSSEGGPRVLDVSAGGAGIIAWRQIIQAHWDSMHTSDKQPPEAPPATKGVVVTGSDTLRHRAASMLENTTFIPRLPDYVHTREIPTLDDDRPAQQRKQFDVIIAPHSILGLKEEWMRKQHIQNLWSLLSSEGGVLILIEKGMPRGFEAIAGARHMLLERHIAVPEGHETYYSRNASEDTAHTKEKAMIVGPCTTHEKCPMYSIPGVSRGRKDVCSFQQRYIRPPFLQRVLGATDRNHDDVDFSYLTVMKGDDLRTRQYSRWDEITDPITAQRHPNPSELKESDSSWLGKAQTGFGHFVPEAMSGHSDKDSMSHPDSKLQSTLPAMHILPRIVYPPIKRKGHVTLDLCTSAGTIERWTIPRSFSKQAYHDARKSRWGDLWALGAKTRTTRNLRLGTSERDLEGKRGSLQQMSPTQGRNRKERLFLKAQNILESREREMMEDAAEEQAIMRELDDELDIDPSIPNDADADYNDDDVNAVSRQRRSAKTQTSPANNQDNESALSDEDVSRILAEWQGDYDRLEAEQNKTSQRSKKIEKQKRRKAERSVYRSEKAGHALHY